ncbi:ribosome small subunit-dependent GTPase A [Myxococcota bacterium]|nr:ribosome small subunit-dependent GTPase A [Myxococcota bacterium]
MCFNDFDALAPLGFDAFFEAGRVACVAADADVSAEPAERPDLTTARVCAAHRDAFDLMTAPDAPVVPARLPGAWRLDHGPEALPTVGDWVLCERPPQGELAVVRHVLPRRSLFVRRAAGGREAPQSVAANVDTVFLVSGLDGDLNPRRLHRYLAQLHDSGARAVLVLNKADDLATAGSGVEALGALAERWPVHPVSALHDTGLDALAPYLEPGRTLALVGSSGVGKSTLANRLLGHDRQATGGVRAHDARGRHTTSRRELFRLPGGALLLDTPGMRSLGLWDAEAGVAAVFDDVDALAGGCRFADCRHEGEPGCALAAAVEDGTLAPERLAEWAALRREAAFEARKNDRLLMEAHRRLWKSRSKAARKMRD